MEERKDVKDKIDALTAKAENEKRELTADEKKELRTLLSQEEQYNDDIETALQLEKRAATSARPLGKNDGLTAEQREMQNFSISKLITGYISKNDISGVSGFEREMIEESEKEARTLGISPSGIYLKNEILAVNKRSMSAGTATNGGNFIPTEKLGFFDAVYNFTVLEQLGVQRLTGLSANTDLTGLSAGATAAWAAEEGNQTPADATTAARELRPELLYSAMDVTKRLLVQTNNSIDAFLMASMQRAMGVALEAAVISGDGTNKPLGILSTGGIQTSAMGTNGGALTYEKVLELARKIKQGGCLPANFKWLTNFAVEAQAKNTSIETGSGAKILAYNMYFGGMPGIIDSAPVFFTQNVPSNLTKGSSGAVCSALIGGDFSQIVIGEFGGVDLVIDNVSAALTRTGKVGITMNQFVDSTILQPSMLGAMVDIIA